MLTLFLDGFELFNNDIGEFLQIPSCVLCFEHSLKSISDWEAHWKIPFLSTEEKTKEMSQFYLQCMCLTKDVDPNVILHMPSEYRKRIEEYIDDPMTATTFSEKGGKKGKRRNEKITSEMIYYWMIEAGIPFTCETWNINRLLALIRVCGIKSSGGGKKMSNRDILNQYSSLNAQRRAKLHTRG